MDSKEAIIQATMDLISERGDHVEAITMRDIGKKSGVGLGLINYHFGSKEKLIEVCVERLINGIIEKFQSIQENTKEMSPYARLEYLGNITLQYLFEHEAISRISVLTDMQTPKPTDNTNLTYRAYLPLVAACRPDWDEETVKRKTFSLITVMQQIFLRNGVASALLGVDLSSEQARKELHAKILHDIMEV